jgi:hypothetical protein
MSGPLNKRVTKLEESVSHLERVKTPRHENETRASPQNASSKKSDSAQRQTSLVEHVASTAPNSERPPKPWYETLQGWYYLLGIIGIPFAIGYAVITYFQWHDLRHSFQVDQRAWVGLAESTNITFRAGETAKITHVLTNSGRTPAIDLITHANSKLVPYGTRFSDSLATYEDMDPVLIGSRSTIMPGKNAYLVLEAKQPVTREHFDDVVSKRSMLYMFGEACYRDIFGDTHYTRFCEFLMPDLTLGNCPTYNYAQADEDGRKHEFCRKMDPPVPSKR